MQYLYGIALFIVTVGLTAEYDILNVLKGPIIHGNLTESAHIINKKVFISYLPLKYLKYVFMYKEKYI